MRPTAPYANDCFASMRRAVAATGPRSHSSAAFTPRFWVRRLERRFWLPEPRGAAYYQMPGVRVAYEHGPAPVLIVALQGDALSHASTRDRILNVLRTAAKRQMAS